LGFGSPVHQFMVADDNIADRHVHAAVLHRRLVWPGKKANDLPIDAHGADEDARQGFMRPLHPKPVQVDLRQFGVEFSLCRRKHFKIRSANGRLIGDGIGKCFDTARRHC
jgi:hypothetical protein